VGDRAVGRGADEHWQCRAPVVAEAIAEDAAERAACKVVHRTFQLFGVDTLNQESVNEFHSDLIYARRLRKTADNMRARAGLVFIGAATLGALAIMWDAIKRAITS